MEPVKIFVTGPPASGKSFYGDQLSHYYNIPHVTVKDALEQLPKMKGEWADGIREKIEAEKDAMLEEQENNKKGPQLERHELKVVFKDKWLYALMRAKLETNDCRNRGFILDGFPRSFKDAQKLFLVKKVKMIINEEGEEVPADEEEGDEEEESADEDAQPEEGEELELKKEKNYDNYETDHIYPDSCLKLDLEDEKLKERVKELPEEKVANSHWNDADMDRRIKAFRDLNNSETDDPALTDFFASHKTEIFESDGDDSLEAFKVYIERKGKPFNYMTFAAESEEERLLAVEEAKAKAEEDELEGNK